MSEAHSDDGFRDLMSRIKSGTDKTAWDELLQRTLPDLWRAAIQALGDGDPPAVGRLVGSTLVAIAARLDEFEPAEDDLGTYAAFRVWWQSLMLAARQELEPTPVPTEQDQESYSSSSAEGAPRRVPELRQGEPLSSLLHGLEPATAAERGRLLCEIRPRLWRAAIQIFGDGHPQRVATLVEATTAAILAAFDEAPAANEDQKTESAFDLWWHGLMVHAAKEIEGGNPPNG